MFRISTYKNLTQINFLFGFRGAGFAFALGLASLLSLASCNKVNDLINPKNGDEKLEDLLVSSPWKVDTLVYGHVDPNKGTIIDSTLLKNGTLTFGKRDKTSGANFDIGLVQHTYTRTTAAGTSTKTDTLFWYPGTYGSITTEGTKLTLFLGRLQDHSYDQNTDCVMEFKKREDNAIIIEGIDPQLIYGTGLMGGNYRHLSLTR